MGNDIIKMICARAFGVRKRIPYHQKISRRLTRRLGAGSRQLQYANKSIQAHAIGPLAHYSL